MLLGGRLPGAGVLCRLRKRQLSGGRANEKCLGRFSQRWRGRAPPQEKRDLPASTCVRGSTALGVKGTSIMFAVICRAKSNGATVGFAVSSPEVRSFSRRPTVTGSGAREKFGSCSKDRNRPVECEAHIDGKVRIEGEFKVDPTKRCTIPISITVNEVTGCEGGVCPAALVTREIFAGHPRGC